MHTLLVVPRCISRDIKIYKTCNRVLIAFMTLVAKLECVEELGGHALPLEEVLGSCLFGLIHGSPFQGLLSAVHLLLVH